MTLQSFKLPAPDSRLIIHSGVIYKVKLNYKYVKANAFLPCAPGVMQREVEAALRAVLHKDNRHKPLKIKTSHFLVDTKFELWPAARKLLFEERGTEVPAYPEKIVLTVQPKPTKRNSVGYKSLEIGQKKSNNKPTKTNGSEATSQNGPKRKSTGNENISLNSSKSSSKEIDRNVTAGTRNNLSLPVDDNINSRAKNVLPIPEAESEAESELSRENENTVLRRRNGSASKRRIVESIDNDNDVQREHVAAKKRNGECRVTQGTGTKPRTRSKSQESDHSNTVTRSVSKDTKRGRTNTARIRTHKTRQCYEEMSTESELSDDEGRHTKPNAPQRMSRYSLRRHQYQDKTLKDNADKTSMKKSAAKVQTRSQSTNTLETTDSVFNSVQRVDKNEVVRRSKRLQVAKETESTPAKLRKHLDASAGNTAERSMSVAHAGTQTQGSTFRIKNADMRLLKKLVVPLKNADTDISGKRPKRMLTSHPSTNEDIGTRSTNREALCYQRDRTLIQQEELAEEMKLQQMALASSSPVSKSVSAVSKDGQKKRRSFMSTLGDILTPVKNMFK